MPKPDWLARLIPIKIGGVLHPVRLEEARSSRLERFYNALSILVAASLVASLAYTAWDSARKNAQDEVEIRFEYRANQIRQATQERVSHYANSLLGARGLFAASMPVSRESWRTYVQSVHYEVNYPSVQSAGFAPWVSSSERTEHISAVQAEGFRGYTIHPPGARVAYTPVLFVEPFQGHNQRMLGYDMFSDPVQRAALNRARDTGDTAIAVEVFRVDKREAEARATLSMYLPIYSEGRNPRSVLERRRLLRGFVYCTLSVDEFMRSTLGDLNDVRIRVYDGATARPEALVYDAPQVSSKARAPVFEHTMQLPIHGQTWTLRASSLPPFEQTIGYLEPRLVAAGGVLITLLLLTLIWVLTTARSRAIAFARRATVDLRRSREQLALALEGSSQAFFDWNVASGEVQLNEHWNAILGGAPQSVITSINELETLVHPNDLPNVRTHLRDVLQGRASQYRVEHRVRAHNGTWKWILSLAKVVEHDSAGRARRVTGTNADITERKRAEEIKNEFIATVSHELRTPLTSVIGALSLLKETIGDDLDPDSSRFLEVAVANSDRLSALVNDVLDIERLDAGLMTMRREHIALGPFLERAVELNRPYAQRFGVDFQLARPLSDLQVIGDEERLMQVVANLLSNAAKFSTRGDVVNVAAEVSGSRARVAVTDHGPGIAPAFRSRIFQRFAQDDSSDSRSKGGTGLGLSISRAIVEKLGGTIGFETEIGQGTTFYFELPLG